MTNLIDYSKKNWDMLATLLITLVAFFVVFSFRTLDINDVDWAVRGGDFSVTYFGSVFYRLDEWRWPIFTHMNLGYPFGISVHGTDGSPLMSLIFKVFHKFFGMRADANFVGIWILISYILQAVASVLIFRHAFKNKFLIVVASLFFVSAPIMLMRVFVHINLMPHFILLFSMLIWLNDKLGKKQWIYMGIIYSLAMVICPYFLPMCTVFFFLLWYKKVCQEKTISWKSLGLGIAFLSAVLVFWYYMLGMFGTTSLKDLSGGGWQTGALNVTALFNPIWSKSQFFNNLTPKAMFDNDNYFGLGLLILLILCIYEVLALFKKKNLKKHWMMALVLAALVLFAMSNRIKMGDTLILSYNPGPFVEWLGGTFRYSARFFWVVWYLLAYFIIKTGYKKFGKKMYWILPLLLIVQIWDLYPSYKMKSDFIWNARPVPLDTVSPEWDRLAKQYDKVFIFAHNRNYRGIWRWAIKHNKKVNYGFLNSRWTAKPVELVNERKDEILSGYVSDPSYFYVIDDELMKRIDEMAKNNPNVAKLKTHIQHIDKYDILEYSEELTPPLVSFAPKKIPVIHQYWQDTLVMPTQYRIYRELASGYKDLGSVGRFDDEMLIINWDRYPPEEFKKGKDGKYYQMVNGKSIEK